MQKILSIFDKMHFLLISQNEFFFHEIKRDGITSLHGIHDLNMGSIQVELILQNFVLVFKYASLAVVRTGKVRV